MKYRVNSDAIPLWLIENLERESSNKCPPECVHCDRIELGMSLDSEYAGLYAAKEIFAQPWLAGLTKNTHRRRPPRLRAYK
jgi:hypothetical protein